MTIFFPISSPALVALLQGIFQKRVLESEVLLDPRAPSCFVIKVNVGSLFVLIRRYLGFFVTLEPGHVLFVEPPRLLLELPSRQVLLVSSLGIIKDKEQTVGTQLFKDLRIVKDWTGRGRVAGCSRVGILGSVLTRALIVC